MWRWIVLGILVLGGAMHWFVHRPIHYQPGVILAPNDPIQTLLPEDQPSILYHDFELYPLAEYDIEGRAITITRYYLDEFSKVAPYDLGIGWGVMSEENNLQQYGYYQNGRWMMYDAPKKEPDVDRTTASSHASNMHLIPADNTVLQKIAGIRPGSIVHLQGYLVRIQQGSHVFAKSSLSRTDTGDGACEIMYVETITVDNHRAY